MHCSRQYSRTGTGKNSAEFASSPKVENADPLYWFRASETYFLKAEAALYDLMAEDVKNLYEAGVKMSMEEWGITDAVATAYLSKGSVKPAALTTSDYHYSNYSNPTVLTSLPETFLPNGMPPLRKKRKLQQIITQKYLALYPNGVEAWTEYRRTGYPYLAALFDSNLPNKIGADAKARTPERFSFSTKEHRGNPNMSSLSTLLNGPNKGAQNFGGYVLYSVQ